MTNFEEFLLVSESIIASCEEAICNLDCTEEVLEFSALDSVRNTVEDMQSLVCKKYENSDNFTNDDEFVTLSIELYQNAKYAIEYLIDDESINDEYVLEQFTSIRKDIDTIRTMCKN